MRKEKKEGGAVAWAEVLRWRMLLENARLSEFCVFFVLCSEGLNKRAYLWKEWPAAGTIFREYSLWGRVCSWLEIWPAMRALG